MTLYYCVEDQRLVAILEYRPQVPDSVRVITVTADEHQRVVDRTHWFDPVQEAVVPVPQEFQDRHTDQQQERQNRAFLERTDWQVLRHIREQALGLPTSLTPAQYLDLEQQRQQAAKNIGISPFSSNNG